MPLATGIPVGNLISQENTYIEGSPYLYIQDAKANPLNNPDTDGYYWGLSGTTTYPVYNIGCITKVSLTDNIKVSDIQCDTIGVKDAIMKRSYLEFDLELRTTFPLSELRFILNYSIPTVKTNWEKVGIGPISNSRHFMVYAPKVYDDDFSYYVLYHMAYCKFVGQPKVDFLYGDAWSITGIKIRAFAVDTLPSAQRFGVFLRNDWSGVLP